MRGNDPEVSVIITAHHEGRLAHHTVKSVLRSADYAGRYGIGSEIIAVLDRANGDTVKYFAQCGKPGVTVSETDFGDPGLARNYGVSLSSGKYVSFLDADDLFGVKWLKAAYEEMERTGEWCVLHPEYVICFGSTYMIAKPKSVYDKDFNPANLIQYNYWNSVHFFAPRELLTENPFSSTPPGSGFGYEDWHWYCEIIAQNIPIRTVPETVVFYRKKARDSRFEEHINQNVLVRPTRLFDPKTFPAVVRRYPSGGRTSR
jgi:glycosyltransferase involved in cell wall biosynthesis